MVQAPSSQGRSFEPLYFLSDQQRKNYRGLSSEPCIAGLDLEQVHQDGNPNFFVEKGVAIGIARRFVGDIMKWVQDVRI